MQTNTKKGSHARLSEYYGKSGKDVIEWTKKVRRVAIANNWRAAQIHMIIAAYLREVAADYYEEESVNITGWAGRNAANNLKDLLVA